MKLSNISFLSKANIKGNTSSKIIIISSFLLVFIVTIVPCYFIATSQAVDNYKQDYRARALELDPWLKPLDSKAINEISALENVQSVTDLKGLRNSFFNITDISGNNKELIKGDCTLDVWGLLGNEERKVIKGKSLDKSPEYSCIIPNLLRLTGEAEETDNVEYIDGETLIGKTLTVKAYNNSLSVLYNYSNKDDMGNKWLDLPAVEFKLKVVGVYYCSPTGFSYDDTALVSEKTAKLMEEVSLKEGGFDLSSKSDEVSKWWNTKELHTHYVIVNEYENISDVYNKISALGYCCSNEPEIMINDSITLIANLFKTIGFVLVFAIIVFTIIVLVNSSISSINKRKSEIGLLKAIGFKNRQIFICLLYEHITLAIKGFLFGGLISGTIILLINYINNQKSYIEKLYIIDWNNYLVFIGISLGISIIVPLICQLVMLRKLSNITPKDAMSSN